VQEVWREEIAAMPDGILFGPRHDKPARQFTAKAGDQKAKQHINVLKPLFEKHEVLGSYTFIVPEPADIANISDGQLQFMKDFLNQPINKKSFNNAYAPVVTHPTRDAPETQLTFEVEGKKLILLITGERHAKRVFFFTNGVPNK
jgi:hypothetical protein